MILSRQKAIENAYAPGGGFYCRLSGDQLQVGGYGRSSSAGIGKIYSGSWQHIAMTLKAVHQEGKNARNTVFEIFLNGRKVYREAYPYPLEVPCTYMDLFGRARRENTGVKETEKLGYGDIEITECFKGSVKQVRLYDSALSPGAIKKLAGLPAD
jgi:hypothetical protein